MKILHINHFDFPDYLNDMVFHGGRSLFGADYEESMPATYMYSDYEQKSRLYGKGFTLYGRLPPPARFSSEREVLQKISDRYFDLIVYGSVLRNKQYSDLVESVYPKNRIIFIDGEDHQYVRNDCLGRGFYFKRELAVVGVPDIYPISFGIPRELVVRQSVKRKLFASIDPADPNTYKYSDEESYYRDYQESYFAFTQRKAGWDCLRHYEILMNNCFPAVRDIELIPAGTMVGFPKEIILEYYARHGYQQSADYESTMCELMNHCEEYCTTEAIWRRILTTLG
jgi:hypothetical protein